MLLDVKRIKKMRKEKGVFQRDVAAVLSVTERHYRLCEAGGVDLPSSKLIALADYFDVSIDYLVGRAINPDCHKNKCDSLK